MRLTAKLARLFKELEKGKRCQGNGVRLQLADKRSYEERKQPGSALEAWPNDLGSSAAAGGLV